MGSYVRNHFGAVSLSVLLHVVIGLAMLFGVTLGRSRVTQAPQPSVIEVVMVRDDPVAIVAERLETQRLEQQRIEQERAEQERVERARIERERREAAEREAEVQRAEEARIALERRQREEAEQFAAEERERERRQAEEEARREAERIAAEQQRLEEERRLAEERRLEEERQAEQRRVAQARREQEERERQLMEAELQAALAEEQEFMEARRSGEFDRYLRQIQTAIEQAWIPPASAREGLECTVNVTQIPSGDVITVDIGSCNGDEAVRRSIEDAVLRASPLPTPAVAALFNRNLQVIFKPQF